jgi:hypothetical protein
MAEAHDTARHARLVIGLGPRQSGQEVRRDPVARDPHRRLRAEQAMLVAAQSCRRAQADHVAQHRLAGHRRQMPAPRQQRKAVDQRPRPDRHAVTAPVAQRLGGGLMRVAPLHDAGLFGVDQALPVPGQSGSAPPMP